MSATTIRVTHPVEDALVGRDLLIERFNALIASSQGGNRVVAVVRGPAGIGKTSLVQRCLRTYEDDEGHNIAVPVVWGTCVERGGAPAYWPWTQALIALERTIGRDPLLAAAADDAVQLSALLPDLDHRDTTGNATDATERDRLLLFDATDRWLCAIATRTPLAIVLDDLQWADESSLALFEFFARSPHAAPLLLVGLVRPDETTPASVETFRRMATSVEHVEVEGLDAAGVTALVSQVVGSEALHQIADSIYHRSGGNPFFARQLALTIGTSSLGEVVPVAIREVLLRRLDHLPLPTMKVLTVAAVCAKQVAFDVVAQALDTSTSDVRGALQPAIDTGFLTHDNAATSFAHDLIRETILSRLSTTDRAEIHASVARAMEQRRMRWRDITVAEIAMHYTKALPATQPEPAVKWSLAAAFEDARSLAFGDAATNLQRLRSALSEAGHEIPTTRKIELLIVEADMLARSGETIDARGLLLHAHGIATQASDNACLAEVVLATVALGARFSMRRDDMIADLESVLANRHGIDNILEAKLTAALTRELQHSISADRARAIPLSERALHLGRAAGDAAALASCLLARHDVLWTPGRSQERADLAYEIVEVATKLGDRERQAQGYLLLANALLEQGSVAFRSVLDDCIATLEELAQPRHRYTIETRRACLALIDDNLYEARDRIQQAATLGAHIGEPDTGNVFMSQSIELVRAESDPTELLRFADSAVSHWTGAPIHAHAIAAGFCARAGDIAQARHHIAAVCDLGTWRADDSYLRSVFLRELSVGAIATNDAALTADLLGEYKKLANSCGVNGAVIAFAGSHAHTASLLAKATGDELAAKYFYERAVAIYERLGTNGWLTSLHRDHSVTQSVVAQTNAALIFDEHSVEVRLREKVVTLANSKGLTDLATLLERPGVEVHVLTLMGDIQLQERSDVVIDRQALDAYRQRIAELDEATQVATISGDFLRLERVEHERDALIDELRRLQRTGRTSRNFSNVAAERARKAVTARIRDAIRRIDAALPELGSHFETHVSTGTYCRYRATSDFAWSIERRSR